MITKEQANYVSGPVKVQPCKRLQHVALAAQLYSGQGNDHAECALRSLGTAGRKTMTFGETIRQLRYSLDLTQAELGLALRRSTQTVSNWEMGRTVPWPQVQHNVLERIKSMLAGRDAAKVERPLDTVSRRVELGRFE